MLNLKNILHYLLFRIAQTGQYTEEGCGWKDKKGPVNFLVIFSISINRTQI